MIPLKSRNSGVRSNCFGVSGGGCVSPGFISEVNLELINHPLLASQLLVGETATNNVAHCEHEAFNVRHIAVVVPECLFVNVAEQVERLDSDVRTVKASLQEVSRSSQGHWCGHCRSRRRLHGRSLDAETHQAHRKISGHR